MVWYNSRKFIYSIIGIILAFIPTILTCLLFGLHWLISWLIFITLVTFIFFGIDKRQAINEGIRIPEATLFFLTFICGTIGNLTGMVVFRHKISKKSFKIRILLIVIFQVMVIIIILYLEFVYLAN